MSQNKLWKILSILGVMVFSFTLTSKLYADARLVVTKWISRPGEIYRANQEIFFGIQLDNYGDALASHVTVRDVLPSNFRPTTANFSDSSGACIISEGTTVECAGLSIPAGTTRYVMIQALVHTTFCVSGTLVVRNTATAQLSSGVSSEGFVDVSLECSMGGSVGGSPPARDTGGTGGSGIGGAGGTGGVSGSGGAGGTGGSSGGSAGGSGKMGTDGDKMSITPPDLKMKKKQLLNK